MLFAPASAPTITRGLSHRTSPAASSLSARLGTRALSVQCVVGDQRRTPVGVAAVPSAGSGEGMRRHPREDEPGHRRARDDQRERDREQRQRDRRARSDRQQRGIRAGTSAPTAT